MARNTSVLGIYSDRTTVAEAISVLHKAGYRNTDISVLSSDNQGSKDFGHEQHTMALPTAAVGALAGFVAGVALGWCIATQTLRITGLEVLVTAGSLVAALAVGGAGAVLGWLIGGIAGLFRSEYVAKRYAGRIRHGGILLSVHCDTPEWCGRAVKTLKNTGARNISSALESAADFGTTDRPTERAPVAVMDRAVMEHAVIERAVIERAVVQPVLVAPVAAVACVEPEHKQ